MRFVYLETGFASEASTDAEAEAEARAYFLRILTSGEAEMSVEEES